MTQDERLATWIALNQGGNEPGIAARALEVIKSVRAEYAKPVRVMKVIPACPDAMRGMG